MPNHLSRNFWLNLFLILIVLGLIEGGLSLSYQRLFSPAASEVINQEKTINPPIVTLTPSPTTFSREKFPTDNLVRCSDDVKKCPNGSYVGRSGPNCSFRPCP